jgi:hypothetical protein
MTKIGKYKLRKYSVLDIGWFWLRCTIAAVAVCVVIYGLGDMIEMVARF